MTKISFEATTLADVIKRANLVSPTRAGSSFDKAAGIVLDITPDEEVKAVVRATDLDMYFMEVVDAIEASGLATRWRLPARPIDAILANQVASGGNKQVVLDDSKDGRLSISCGHMRGGLNLINPSGYPDFDTSPDLEYTEVNLLGPAIDRVAWAADKNGSDAFAGIHFDGQYVIAANRQRMARIPLQIALDTPITVSAGMLPQLLRQQGLVRLAVDGTMLVVEPDEYTRITVNTFGNDYPPVQKAMQLDYPQEVTVVKAHLIAAINSALAVTGSDRAPRLALYLGVGKIAVYLNNDEVGKVGDIVHVPGQIPHERIEKGFNPQTLLEALAHAPSDKVVIKYDPAQAEKGAVLIDGGSGYMTWLAPRGKQAAA